MANYIRLSKNLNRKLHHIVVEIEKERVRRNIAQDKLSYLAGGSKSQWSHYLNGSASLTSIHTLERYLKVFGKKLIIVDIEEKKE